MTQATLEGTVDEYTVMYTPQVRQKQKKWHDGVAKYYYFNSLLVLYNESNVKIDSSFLGRNRVLELGEELNTDNHLITLEEKTKVTTRDISGIHSKRRNEDQAVAEVLRSYVPPTIAKRTKSLSNVSERLKQSLSTPVKSSMSKNRNLGPTRLPLTKASTSYVDPARVDNAPSPSALHRTSDRHSRTETGSVRDLEHSPLPTVRHISPTTPTALRRTPTLSTTSTDPILLDLDDDDDDDDFPELTLISRAQPVTPRTPVTPAFRAPASTSTPASTSARIISAAPNPTAPFKRPFRAPLSDISGEIEPALPLPAATVRARRVGIGRPNLRSVESHLERSPSPTTPDQVSTSGGTETLRQTTPEPMPFDPTKLEYLSPIFIDMVKSEPSSPLIDTNIQLGTNSPDPTEFLPVTEPREPPAGEPDKPPPLFSDIEHLSQLAIPLDDSSLEEALDSFTQQVTKDPGDSSIFNDRFDLEKALAQEELEYEEDEGIMEGDSSLYTTDTQLETPQNASLVVEEVADEVADNVEPPEASAVNETPLESMEKSMEVDLELRASEAPLHDQAVDTSTTRREIAHVSGLFKPPGTSVPIDKPFSVPFAKPPLNLPSAKGSTKCQKTPGPASKSTSQKERKIPISDQGAWTKETLELFAWRG